jgi:hypothetical protein
MKVRCPDNVYRTFVLNDAFLGECISCTICPFDSTKSMKEGARSQQNRRSPTLRAFGQLLGRYVRCRLRRTLTAHLFCRLAVFLNLIIVVRNVELIWDGTHQAPSSKGRIVQWVNRPRDESSDGRIVQTSMNKTSVGDELKLHQSQRRVVIATAFSFVHILYIYNTDWAISHVLIFM